MLSYLSCHIYIYQAMLDLPTNTFNAYKLQGSLLAIMDLEKCYITSSVELKNQVNFELVLEFNTAHYIYIETLCRIIIVIELMLIT